MAKKKGESKPAYKMADLELLVRSQEWPGTWGRGPTIEEALKIARKPKYYDVFLVAPGTCCESTFGGLCYNADYPPRLIHQVSPRRKPAARSAAHEHEA